jgi:hypothetical protein
MWLLVVQLPSSCLYSACLSVTISATCKYVLVYLNQTDGASYKPHQHPWQPAAYVHSCCMLGACNPAACCSRAELLAVLLNCWLCGLLCTCR